MPFRPQAAWTQIPALTPFDLDEAEVRASTRKLVALAKREGVTLIIHGHDQKQWQQLKLLPEYYT